MSLRNKLLMQLQKRWDLHKQSRHKDPPNFDPFFDVYDNKTQPWMDLFHLPPSVIDKSTF
jgi:hypothetical protein